MEPNQMGAAGQPMPSQIPNQPVQPMQAAQPVQAMQPEMPTATMTMEQQMAAAMQEQAPVAEVAPAPAEQPEPKKGHGMLIGLILAIVVALGGIGFGVYMMISGNNAAEDYKKQIATLKGTVNQLSTAATSNPVIKAEAPLTYSMSMQSFLYTMNDGTSRRASVIVTDGKITSCEMYSSESLASSFTSAGNCTINGVEGDIYKLINVGEGQDTSFFAIGFVKTDGAVDYIKYSTLFDNGGTATIDGTLNIDGSVKDAMTVNVISSEGAGGYLSTIFVLSDGSYIKYDNTMTEQAE